jgi:hypothetical protein
VCFVHRRGNKKIAKVVEKRRQARINREDGRELQERGHREAPPAYKEEGESIGTRRADRGVGVGQKPPGYHDAHVIPKEEE